MQEIHHPLKIITVHFLTPEIDEQEALVVGEELESLILTLGGTVVDRVLERFIKPDNATYIGKITLKQLERRIKRENIDVVVLNAMTKPRQIHTIRETLRRVNPKIEVWDLVDLILQIFDKHATTTEAKLQIEMARMRYMGPRIYGMGKVLSQQGGGIGTSGIGETNTELMKRHWRNELKRIEDQLEKIEKSKQQQLERRKRTGMKTVSIVGYTNAGKSSLFNALTKKDTLVENALFATLDSIGGKIYIPDLQQEVLLTDTIGFIRNLPPKLISAFKSTLLESIHADLLLHVIDVSDPEVETKIAVVLGILSELKIDLRNIVFVFNKMDMVGKEKKEMLLQKYSLYSPIFISVKTRLGLENIKNVIAEKLTNGMAEISR